MAKTKNLISRLNEAIREKKEKEEFIKDCYYYSPRELADALYDFAAENARLVEEKEDKPEIPRIRISQEQFAEHFKIIGLTDDGKIETRGRRYKTTD